mmetsp:Transcript_7507/g.22230  ORF Transcript_7507/g.22230 Transcript_7507/m.22230 type:complete len:155 (+) Transcript_7507:1380-1844(+)
MASGKARWCGACVLHWNGAKPWVLANRSNGKLSASRADAQSEWLTAARLLDARLPECAALPSLGSVQAAAERNAASRDAHHEDLERATDALLSATDPAAPIDVRVLEPAAAKAEWASAKQRRRANASLWRQAKRAAKLHARRKKARSRGGGGGD